MQKVISCEAKDVESKLDKLINDGWTVNQMVAENVSTSVSISTGSEYNKYDKKNTEKGLIVFLLTKY